MNWAETVGKFIRVGQEVKLEDVWSEIQLEGWVARVQTIELSSLSDFSQSLVMDTGEEWTVEDGEQFVRKSILLPSSSKGMPRWQRQPDKWVQTDEGWDRNPVVPKVEDCDCSRCSLYDSVLVDAKRTEECDVLFVGEAPGWEEAQSNPPSFFIGRAGKLLRALIAQTGVAKFKYGFNNTCICHATEAPSDEDIKACKGRLLKEIKQANPRLIVAIGGVALQALTGISGITEHQGLLMDWEGRKLLPCFHSAAVIRRPELFYSFAETIYKAGLYLQGNNDLDVQPKDIKVTFADDEAKLAEALVVLDKAEKLYIDLETSNYSPYKDRILCIAISWRDPQTHKASKASYVFSWKFIKEHFSSIKIIVESKLSAYWNAFFDAQFFRQNGIKSDQVEDIMLKQYTLDETPLSQSLKGNARVRCNAPDWEEPLKQYLPNRSTSFEVIPVEVLYLYNGYDAAYTGILDDVISARMDDSNWRVYNEILIPALRMFLDTCDIGMKVDVARLDELRIELQAELEKVRQQLQEIDPECINPSSIKQARHLIYDVLGLNTESTSTSRTTLEDHKGITGVDLLLKFRETRKLLGTYVEGLVDDLVDDVVHPNIRLNGTVTGRLSSSNPNFFGIPDEKGGIKKLYKARYPGWGIGNGDGAQMEIRVLGALSKDKQMIEDFKKGVDFHGAARDRLYGRGFAKSNYNHQEVLDAKTAVFGPIYGRGAASLAQQFYHSELADLRAKGEKIRWPIWNSLPRDMQEERIDKAQNHIDKLWYPYPLALSWLKENVRKGQEDGELMSYYGRYRHWGLVTDETLEDIKTQGRNFPVQSPSSDTNLLIMIGSYQTFSREVYIPIFPVHDSVVFMYKLGEEKQLIPQLKQYFERRAQELLQTDMRFTYEFSMGLSWGDQEVWKD